MNHNQRFIVQNDTFDISHGNIARQNKNILYASSRNDFMQQDDEIAASNWLKETPRQQAGVQTDSS